MTTSQIPAEARSSFERGLEALSLGDVGGARAALEEAFRVATGNVQVMSAYGLSLALDGSDRLRGVALCEEAVRRSRDRATADLFANLGRAYLAVQYRAQAVEALRRGIHVDPEHGEILDQLKRLGMRRPPVIPFLSRGNPLNKYLGMLRHRIFPPRPEDGR